MSERPFKKSLESNPAPLQEKLEIFQAFLDLLQEFNSRIGKKIAEATQLNELIQANSGSLRVIPLLNKQMANNSEITRLLELSYKTAVAMRQAEHLFAQKAGIDPSLGEMRSKSDARSN